MKNKTLFTILFATLAVYGCSSDSGGGAAGSGGSAGTGGTAGSGGSAGTGGSAGEGGMGGSAGEGGMGGSAGEGGMGGSAGMGGVPGTEFAEDFESLDPTNAMALSQDGWVGFANIWQPDGTSYIRGYSPGEWDGTSGFSNVAEGQGGVTQGNQQIAVFSDYNNQPDQTAGNRVEANTFRERDIVADDVGKTMTFSFDAKRGNINDPADSGCTGTTNPPCDSSALAFIKTLDPGDGFATTNFETEDTTAIPETWMRYEISLAIDAGLVGQKIQFGFSATASNNEPSGVFYDNVLVVTATP